MRFVGIVLAAMLVAALATNAVSAAQVIPGGADNFESYALGTIFTTVASPPPGANDTWGDSATYIAGSKYDIVEVSPLHGNPNNQVVRVVDVVDTTTKNTHLRTNFQAGPWPNTGVYHLQLNVMPLQDNGPFKIVMTNGGGWTSGLNWIAALAFGSSGGNTFFPGMTTGTKLGLQTTTTAYVDTANSYSANTWYTVKFIVDITSRKYQAFYGPVDSALSEITAGPQPWITGSAGPPTTFGGLYFATSNKANEGAQFLVDDVLVTPEPSSLAALAAGAGTILAGLLRRKTR